MIGNLENPDETMNSVRNVDIVFHNTVNPEVWVDTLSPAKHFNENVVTTFNLLEVLGKHDVKELVFAPQAAFMVSQRTYP